MNKIKIPKSFEINGRTIQIKYDENMMFKHNCTGEANYRQDAIVLQKKCEGFERNENQLVSVYLHEIVHWILYAMGEDELRDNEKFVIQFSGALHQILKTSNYK